MRQRVDREGKQPLEFDVTLRVGDTFAIRGAIFRVTYINGAKGRFTCEPIRGLVRDKPGGAPCVEQS